MKLQTLKPRIAKLGSSIQIFKPSRPGLVERKRGSAGVKDREKIRARDKALCKNCNYFGRDVDHDVPLWAGCTDEADNKQLLCIVCHQAKTELEAKQRATGAYDRDAVMRLMAGLRRERLVSFDGLSVDFSPQSRLKDAGQKQERPASSVMRWFLNGYSTVFLVCLNRSFDSN